MTSLSELRYTDAFTLDVIARVGFGVQMDSQKDPNNPFLINGRKIFNFNFTWKNPVSFILCELYCTKRHRHVPMHVNKLTYYVTKFKLFSSIRMHYL